MHWPWALPNSIRSFSSIAMHASCLQLGKFALSQYCIIVVVVKVACCKAFERCRTCDALIIHHVHIHNVSVCVCDFYAGATNKGATF